MFIYIINYFNLPPFEEDFQSDDVLLQDWGILQRYSEIAQKKNKYTVNSSANKQIYLALQECAILYFRRCLPCWN